MIIEEPPTFGALLSRYRAAALLTQEELAERASLSARGVSDLERGVKTRPRAYTVRQLSDALRLSIHDRATFEQAASAAPTESRPDSALPEGSFLGALPAHPLVARDEEVGRMRSGLDAVADGAGHFLLLGGEMGCGKTRLLQHLMVEARGRSFTVLVGRCYSAERATPFYPFLEALGGLDSHLPPDFREAHRDWHRIRQLVGEYAADRSSGLAVAQQRIFNAAGKLLLLIARSGPVALLLDDLQWADADSLKLLQHLAHTTRASPILLAGSFREVELSEDDRELAGLLRELGRERLVERVTVRRLSLEETIRLVAATMGQPDVSEEFAAFVYRRTKGLPRLIDQLVRSLGGRLELRGEIGAGSMGRVFRAFDRSTGKTVAAKLVLARTEIQLDTLLRFQQEGAVLAALDHPNIVDIHDTFAEEHASCIVMELLDGQSLGRILRDGPLPLARARYLALQVADALSYAHAQSIAHRDIKPDNIMVLEGDRVKVTDFGIARILQSDTSLQTFATTGMRMGTPLYMAPEQIEGKKIDARTDIYALGATLYHMVTGRPPFEGDDPLAVALKHVQQEPLPPSSIDPTIPVDWDAVVLKALAKDPARRFQSAGEMGMAIATLSEKTLVTPREPSVDAQTVSRRGRRVRWFGAAAGLSALVLAGGLFLHWPGSGHPRASFSSRLVASWAIPASPLELPSAPSAVAVSGDGTVYAIDSGTGRVVKISPAGHVLKSWGTLGSGPGELLYPRGLALDRQGNVYVVDTGNDRIEKFSPDGRFLAGWGKLGSGPGELRSPQGVTVGTNGTIYIADTDNRRVQALTPAGAPVPNWDPTDSQRGNLSRPTSVAVFPPTVGPADVLALDASTPTGSTLNADGSYNYSWDGVGNPSAIAMDDHSNYYILYPGRDSVQEFDANGIFLRSLHGRFHSARGLAVDARGNVYVADTGNHRILKLGPAGTILASWTGPSAVSQSAAQPQALARDARGNLYLADTSGNQILVLSPSGQPLAQWKGGGRAGSLGQPSGVAVGAHGHVFVTDTGKDRVLTFSSAGTVEAAWGMWVSGAGQFLQPNGVAVDPQENVYVVDTFDGVEEFSSTGRRLRVLSVPETSLARGSLLSFSPEIFGMALDSRGYVYLTDFRNDLIVKLSPRWTMVAEWGGTGSRPGRLLAPKGVAVGPSGAIYVADTDNSRVEMFTPTGELIGTITEGLDQPTGVLAVAGSGGADTLYVADSGNGHVDTFSVTSF